MYCITVKINGEKYYLAYHERYLDAVGNTKGLMNKFDNYIFDVEPSNKVLVNPDYSQLVTTFEEIINEG